MKKKSAKEKQETNASKGKAQAKHKTVGKEIYKNMNMKNDEFPDNHYPPILRTEQPTKKKQKALEDAKFYYDLLIDELFFLGILFRPIDKIQIGNLAINLVQHDELKFKSLGESIIIETNGNTNTKQKKINPALAESLRLQKIIQSIMTDYGINPKSRADLMTKLHGLKTEDVIDNDSAKGTVTGRSLDSYLPKDKDKHIH